VEKAQRVYFEWVFGPVAELREELDSCVSLHRSIVSSLVRDRCREKAHVAVRRLLPRA
jgi:hypothetical protein